MATGHTYSSVWTAGLSLSSPVSVISRKIGMIKGKRKEWLKMDASTSQPFGLSPDLSQNDYLGQKNTMWNVDKKYSLLTFMTKIQFAYTKHKCWFCIVILRNVRIFQLTHLFSFTLFHRKWFSLKSLTVLKRLTVYSWWWWWHHGHIQVTRDHYGATTIWGEFQ